MKTKATALVGAFIFLAMARAQQPPATTPAPGVEPSTEVTPHHPDEISRLREEWTPPGEEPRASGSGDARGFLAHYLSTKPFPEVWTHYAAKLGLTPAPGSDLHYQPNSYTQVFPRLGPRVSDGHATLTIKNIQFPNETDCGATLTRQEPNGRTVTIFMASQGDRTFVSVLVAPLH